MSLALPSRALTYLRARDTTRRDTQRVQQPRTDIAWTQNGDDVPKFGSTIPGAAGRRARGVALGALLAMAAVGCSGPSVALLTGRGGLGPLPSGMFSCYTDFAVGQLVVEPTYGTAIVENNRQVPVMWPVGFIGRRSGGQVEVVNTQGSVVARTGNRYQIEGGYGGTNPTSFVACGYVLSK